MLMDLFYDEVPVEKKQRVHFHSFMLDVHSSMYLSLPCVSNYRQHVLIKPLLPTLFLQLLPSSSNVIEALAYVHYIDDCTDCFLQICKISFFGSYLV